LRGEKGVFLNGEHGDVGHEKADIFQSRMREGPVLVA
jgi:hypothetical protein